MFKIQATKITGLEFNYYVVNPSNCDVNKERNCV